MKFRTFRTFRVPSPSVAMSATALFLALGGGAAFAASQTVNNSKHLGGHDSSWYLPAKHFVSSHGEHFLHVGQTMTLGRAGHFVFSASCTNPSGAPGAQQVTFDVKANTTAGLDGNPPMSPDPGHRYTSLVNIHTNGDSVDSSPGNTIPAGTFDQVGSASSSTEIAADGQEVDIFYNDGVNWPGHPCFAGYTGFMG
jgi:hypothetical protein